ncbi:MAG: carboxypeptidase-like regulatory domain-containing protein [Siphonobacter sp.]
MIKFYSLIGLLFCFILPVKSQHIIHGHIVDTAGKAISGSSVWVESGKNMVAYAISKSDGSFKISVDPGPDSLILVAKALNYKPYRQAIFNQTQQVSITLQSQVTQLKEVEIKSRNPIRRNGDTLFYSTNDFTTGKDRVITDVLKKLPGVTVEADGRILYQGEAIQKFYIEGMDLLSNQYNLATNNLPAKSVKEIQVIERHQPIRILDSLIRSERASINLKLTNKIAKTGSFQAGVGIFPFLWDLNITPMAFTSKQQFVASYQTNNIGKDVSLDLKIFSIEDLQDNLNQYTQKVDLLAIQGLSPPAFDSKRILFNKTHLLSLNYLRKLNKYTNIKINSSYLNNHIQQKGLTDTYFITEGDSIHVYENKYNQQFIQEVKGSISLTQNAPNQYLENTLSTKIVNEKQEGIIENNNGKINQKLNNPFYSISNKFKLIKPIGKQLFGFHSSTFFNKTPQILSINYPYSKDSILFKRQNILFQQFHTNNYINFTKKTTFFVLFQTIGFLYESQQLNSSLNTSLSYSNNQFQKWYKYYSITEGSHEFNQFKFSINLPVSFWKINPHILQRIITEPSVSVKYQLSSIINFKISYRTTNLFSNLSDLNIQPVLKDYRTSQFTELNYRQYYTHSFNAGIYYSEPIHSVFGNLTYSLTNQFSNALLLTTITSNGDMLVQSIKNDNRTPTHLLNGYFSKYFLKLKTTIRLSSIAQVNQTNQEINGIYSKVINYNLSNNFNLEKSFSNRLIINYSFDMIHQKTTINRLNSGLFNSKNHHFDSMITVYKKHYLTFSGEVYTLKYASTLNSNHFFDLGYRGFYTKRKIEIECKWQNLTDTNTYTYLSSSNYTYILTRYQLRPSQLLISFRMSL